MSLECLLELDIIIKLFELLGPVAAAALDASSIRYLHSIHVTQLKRHAEVPKWARRATEVDTFFHWVIRCESTRLKPTGEELAARIVAQSSQARESGERGRVVACSRQRCFSIRFRQMLWSGRVFF